MKVRVCDVLLRDDKKQNQRRGRKRQLLLHYRLNRIMLPEVTIFI